MAIEAIDLKEREKDEAATKKARDAVVALERFLAHMGWSIYDVDAALDMLREDILHRPLK